jgi:hypothetical protein
MNYVLRTIGILSITIMISACGNSDEQEKKEVVSKLQPVESLLVPKPKFEPVEEKPKSAPLTNEQLVAVGGRALIADELVLELVSENIVESSPPIPVEGKVSTVVFIDTSTGVAIKGEKFRVDTTACMADQNTYEECHAIFADKISGDSKMRREDTCMDECLTKGHREVTYTKPAD